MIDHKRPTFMETRHFDRNSLDFSKKRFSRENQQGYYLLVEQIRTFSLTPHDFLAIKRIFEKFEDDFLYNFPLLKISEKHP